MIFLLETFILGLKNLRLHKLRSLLTALGIIIGVAAFIIMVAIGEGSKQAALEQIRQLGVRNILVQSVRPPESSESSNKSQRMLDYGLKRLDLTRLQTLPGLEAVVPLRDTEQKVLRGDRRIAANPIGTTPQVFGVINLRLARGEFFTDLQYERAEPVCVIGDQAARLLFPYEQPIGEKIQLGGMFGSCVLTVIGVLEPIGVREGSEGAAMMRRNLDLDIYFPLTVARQSFGDTIIRRQPGSVERKNIELSEIWLKARNVEDVESLSNVARSLVSVGGPPRQDVEIKAPISILRKAERVNRTFNFVMGGIAGFSLLVGGIGIMNIMLATVTERTREIGIRRALGAERKHITLQFLIETTVITLTGGLIGICLGSAFASALPSIVRWFSQAQTYPTEIATWSVLGSFLASGLIGIGFGLYPAVMAARMNPIEALRHE